MNKILRIFPAKNEESLKSIGKEDSIFLPNLNNSDMMSVTLPLIGINYMIWSRFVRVTLGAKLKIDFIDGRFMKIGSNSILYNECLSILCRDVFVLKLYYLKFSSLFFLLCYLCLRFMARARIEI